MDEMANISVGDEGTAMKIPTLKPRKPISD